MLSVVILTKNEEKNILDCLETVSWVDQIIVLDDFSSDRTIEVIKSLNLKKTEVYKRRIDGNFAAQRNFGIEKTKGEWILFVDADERVTPDLRSEINDMVIDEKNKPLHNGFIIKRKDYLWGKELRHGETGNIKLLRLARKGGGKWIGNVHEVWQVEGNIGKLDYPLSHYPHQSISQFLEEINFYTNLRASQLYKDGVNIKTRQIILYPIGKFLINYFVRLGFLDGIAGLVIAVMMSFHSFLVRAKLWSLWRIS